MSSADDSLIREVDEDLRRERLAQLWKRYGSWLISAAVALVLVVAGFEGWRSYQRSAREAAGRDFQQAEQRLEGDRAAAAEGFAAVARDGTAGYALLARLREAEARAVLGDAAAARQIYGAIAASADDAIGRDLSTLLDVMTVLARPDSVIADPQALSARLEPLSHADGPWRFSAREMMAMLALEAGDPVKARELLDALRTDGSAPGDLRARADEMVQQLNKG
jgi:hypothetical protein